MNDVKNMAGMVSEKVQACGDGFCDRAARESAKIGAAIGARMRAADAAAEPPGTPIGLDAFLSASENAKRPCCPCLVAHHPACSCRCHAPPSGQRRRARYLSEMCAGADGVGCDLVAGHHGPHVAVPTRASMDFISQNRTAVGSGLAQQPPPEQQYRKEFETQFIGSPGKQFSRSDILAILRAQHTLARLETSTSEWKAAKNSTYRDIINIFENLE